MFKFRKAKKNEQEEVVATPPKQQKQNWFKKLCSGLQRTRGNLAEGLSRVVIGKKNIDDELFEELETILLMADVGAEVTKKILNDLTQQASRQVLNDPQALITHLRELLLEIIRPCSIPLEINQQPFTILMVGINGAGKTTSIAKLAHQFKQQGKEVILAAGDTFRAAAVEQLKVWGERNAVPVIAQQKGADSASVVYDSLQAAYARKAHILIADTAGRLHTQSHLMDELAKIKRVMRKLDETAPHETLLVLDAGTGQNAITQAKQFNDAIGIDGIVLTKLDGTAKGGILFSIADSLKLPIRFIGIGEELDDLKPFNAEEFIDALFTNPST